MHISNDLLVSLFIAIITVVLIYVRKIMFYLLHHLRVRKLTKHYLFSELKAWEREAKLLKFVNEFKTKLGRDIWRIKLEIGYKHLYNWAKAVEKGQVKDISTIFVVIDDIVEEYNKLWKIEGIFDEVINQFNEYHNNNVQVLIHLIEIELHSQHKTIKEKAFEILNYFRAIYIIAKGDLQRVINSSNGKLADKIYKGVKNTNEYIEGI